MGKKDRKRDREGTTTHDQKKARSKDSTSTSASTAAAALPVKPLNCKRCRKGVCTKHSAAAKQGKSEPRAL